MAKYTFEMVDGWPRMSIGEPKVNANGTKPVALPKKVVGDWQRTHTEGEGILGCLIGMFDQTVITTRSRVIICKHGLMAGATFGSKVTSYGYSQLTGVQIRTGVIGGVFELIGPGLPLLSSGAYSNKAEEAPHTVPFAKAHVNLWEVSLGGKIREMLPGASVPQSAPQAPASDDLILGQIEQLGKLRDAGVLTEEEFVAKKSDLLSRL